MSEEPSIALDKTGVAMLDGKTGLYNYGAELAGVSITISIPTSELAYMLAKSASRVPEWIIGRLETTSAALADLST